MDQRTIIIAVAVLAVLGIIWYSMQTPPVAPAPEAPPAAMTPATPPAETTPPATPTTPPAP
ncbi:MAG: hypothetical protein WDN31_20675 [Hyphomicrobium sp.]